MRLLDTEFKWVPSFATDVRETWRRFGYQPMTAEQRRARLRALEMPIGTPMPNHIKSGAQGGPVAG